MQVQLIVQVPTEAYRPRLSHYNGIMKLEFTAVPLDARVAVKQKHPDNPHLTVFQLRLTFSSLKQVLVQVDYREQTCLGIHHHLVGNTLYLIQINNPENVQGTFQRLSEGFVKVTNPDISLVN